MSRQEDSYPPTYRSSPSPPHGHGHNQYPGIGQTGYQYPPAEAQAPSSSYQFDYQRRRESRQGGGQGGQGPQSVPMGYGHSYASPAPSYPGTMSSAPSYPNSTSPSPYIHQQSTFGGHPSGPSGSGRDEDLENDVNGEEDATIPLKSGTKDTFETDLNDRGYPKAWTREDEEAEKEFMAKGLFDWKKMTTWGFWFKKKWWYWYIILIVCCVLVGLMTMYHDDIVNWLKPVANWMKDLPAGWTIPIAIMFIISFPPLFGHEIVAILVGAVWGLWVGFGIVSAGTFLGEVGNFYAFKYCLRSRAEKIEKKNFNYACLAHVVREGGFFIIFMARISAIPGHFTTAVFATCGMNIWIFSLACILSMPKQLVVVYLGVMFAEDSGQKTMKDKIISGVMLAVGFLATVWAGWYIYKEMRKARLTVWRRKRMQLKASGTLDPLTGKERKDVRKSFPTAGILNTKNEADEELEMRSPMIKKSQKPAYQTPYQVDYSEANQSTYEFNEPRVVEQDLSEGYGYNMGGGIAQSTDSFAPPSTNYPQQQQQQYSPHHQQQYNLSPNPYGHNQPQSINPESRRISIQQFPSPRPAQPQSQSQPQQPNFGIQSPPSSARSGNGLYVGQAR